jgi:hypothetical protein
MSEKSTQEPDRNLRGEDGAGGEEGADFAPPCMSATAVEDSVRPLNYFAEAPGTLILSFPYQFPSFLCCSVVLLLCCLGRCSLFPDLLGLAQKAVREDRVHHIMWQDVDKVLALVGESAA